MEEDKHLLIPKEEPRSPEYYDNGFSGDQSFGAKETYNSKSTGLFQAASQVFSTVDNPRSTNLFQSARSHHELFSDSKSKPSAFQMASQMKDPFHVLGNPSSTVKSCTDIFQDPFHVANNDSIAAKGNQVFEKSNPTSVNSKENESYSVSKTAPVFSKGISKNKAAPVFGKKSNIMHAQALKKTALLNSQTNKEKSDPSCNLQGESDESSIFVSQNSAKKNIPLFGSQKSSDKSIPLFGSQNNFSKKSQIFASQTNSSTKTPLFGLQKAPDKIGPLSSSLKPPNKFVPLSSSKISSDKSSLLFGSQQKSDNIDSVSRSQKTIDKFVPVCSTQKTSDNSSLLFESQKTSENIESVSCSQKTLDKFAPICNSQKASDKSPLVIESQSTVSNIDSVSSLIKAPDRIAPLHSLHKSSDKSSLLFGSQKASVNINSMSSLQNPLDKLVPFCNSQNLSDKSPLEVGPQKTSDNIDLVSSSHKPPDKFVPVCSSQKSSDKSSSLFGTEMIYNKISQLSSAPGTLFKSSSAQTTYENCNSLSGVQTIGDVSKSILNSNQGRKKSDTLFNTQIGQNSLSSSQTNPTSPSLLLSNDKKKGSPDIFCSQSALKIEPTFWSPNNSCEKQTLFCSASTHDKSNSFLNPKESPLSTSSGQIIFGSSSLFSNTASTFRSMDETNTINKSLSKEKVSTNHLFKNTKSNSSKKKSKVHKNKEESSKELGLHISNNKKTNKESKGIHLDNLSINNTSIEKSKEKKTQKVPGKPERSLKDFEYEEIFRNVIKSSNRNTEKISGIHMAKNVRENVSNTEKNPRHGEENLFIKSELEECITNGILKENDLGFDMNDTELSCTQDVISLIESLEDDSQIDDIEESNKGNDHTKLIRNTDPENCAETHGDKYVTQKVNSISFASAPKVNVKNYKKDQGKSDKLKKKNHKRISETLEEDKENYKCIFMNKKQFSSDQRLKKQIKRVDDHNHKKRRKEKPLEECYRQNTVKQIETSDDPFFMPTQQHK
ncbi:unnamed protein product, partial [Meganyctiphanes norvegica]